MSTRTGRTFIHCCTATGLAMSMASTSQAVYTGLQVVGTPVIAGGAPRTVYRVYAMFTDANDYLCVVNGSPTASTMVIQSRNANDTGLGSNFFNPLGGGGIAPTLAAIAQNPDVAYDTFVDIGLSFAEQGPFPDDTMFSPTFAGIGSVNQVSLNNDGWFVHGPMEQGRAGWLGDGDPLLRVLMMQLTVNAGDNVRGTANIAGVNQTPLAGAASFTISNQTFNSIPAPGSLALIGLASWLGSNRRRRPVGL